MVLGIGRYVRGPRSASQKHKQWVEIPPVANAAI